MSLLNILYTCIVLQRASTSFTETICTVLQRDSTSFTETLCTEFILMAVADMDAVFTAVACIIILVLSSMFCEYCRGP